MTLFDEDLGAQKQILFGCTVRSVIAEAGFSGQRFSVVVTLVQEEGQIFTLNTTQARTDIGAKSLETITLGAFSFIGFVGSWEEVLIGTQGSGIFTVKLVDAGSILDGQSVVLGGGDVWGSLADSNSPLGSSSRTKTFGGEPFTLPNLNGTADVPVDKRGDPIDYGPGVINVILDSVDESKNFSVKISSITEAITRAEILFGNNNYKIDFSEVTEFLKTKSGSDDDPDSQLKLAGSSKTITEILDRLAFSYDFIWFIKVLQDEDSNINIIKIRIHDLAKSNSPEMSIQDLLALHTDRVISYKEGLRAVKRFQIISIIQGTKRKELVEHSGSGIIKPFWGWTTDSGEIQEFSNVKNTELFLGAQGGTRIGATSFAKAFTPLSGPAVHIPGTPESQLRGTSLGEMQNVLRGELDDQLSTNVLDALSHYARTHFGKKFYVAMDEADWDKNGKTWIDLVPSAWWESDIFPDGKTPSQSTFFNEFSTKDGKWVAFLRLPDPRLAGNGNTVFVYDDIITRSNNSIILNAENGAETIYTRVLIERVEHFWVITLPNPTITVHRDLEDPDKDIKQRVTNFNTASVWIPQTDFRTFYGPWSSADNIPEDFDIQSPSVAFSIDATLAPWNFATRGTSHSTAMEKMNHAAYVKTSTLKPQNEETVSAEIEVADLPAIDLGQIIVGDTIAAAGRGIIRRVSTSFTIAGIKTRYSIIGLQNTVGGLLGELVAKQEREDKEDDENLELKEDGPVDPNEFPPDEKNINDDEITTSTSLEEESTQVLLKKPEGGKGQIISKGTGPFYTIKRLNARQLTSGLSSQLDLSIVPTWTDVRNLGENIESPGFLPIGLIVTVSIYEDEIGGAEAFMEITPPNFAPPIPQ